MATVSLVITSAKNSTDKLPRICDYYISPCNTTFTLVQWHISVNNSCTLKVAFSLTYWYIYWSNYFFVGLWTEQQASSKNIRGKHYYYYSTSGVRDCGSNSFTCQTVNIIWLWEWGTAEQRRTNLLTAGAMEEEIYGGREWPGILQFGPTRSLFYEQYFRDL